MDVRMSVVTAATSQSGVAQVAQPAKGGAGAPGFAGALEDALKTVSRLQDESASAQRQFEFGDGKVGLEQTMLAMQNAQVAFQAALTVRNRLVSAYTDIMNMPV